MAAIALVVAGCSVGDGLDATAEGSGGELQATRWVLNSSASEGNLALVPDDLYADAEFRAQRVRGFAGCNDYDAIYRNASRMLLVSMPALTRVACGDAANAFEASYMTLLQASRFYDIRADTLIIRGADRSILLVFDAAPVNPLLGSWVVDSYVDTSGALVAPLEGTELTLVFRLVKVGGSAGCNTFEGPYTTNGAVAAIGPLGTTLIACAEDVMAQETAFLEALQGVGLVEPRAQSLELRDRSGGVLVVLSRPTASEPSASPSVAPVASATAVPSQSPSAKPSAAVTPPSTPTPTPTAAPTPTPAASASTAPTVAPPASLPPVASCSVSVDASQVPFGTIVYPSDWYTVAQPPTLACRYFDPEPLTVPADPATLSAAVTIKADATLPYVDALAAATNPNAWNVLVNKPVTTSGGLAARRIEATSTTGLPGYPVDVTRYGYLIDLGDGSAWIETSGTLGDPAYEENTSVVDLIVSESTFAAPS